MNIIKPLIQGNIKALNNFYYKAFTIFLLDSTKSISAFINKYNGSFSRASTITVKDHEGIYKTVSNNIPAFYGGREETNLIKHSMDISASGWAPDSGVTITGTDTFLADSAADRIIRSVTTKANHLYIISAVISVNSGNLGKYRFFHGDSASGQYSSIFTVSRNSKRYAAVCLGKSGGGDVSFGFQDMNTSSWVPVKLTSWKVIDVSGSLVQAPSDNIIITTTDQITKWFNTISINHVYDGIVRESVCGNYPKGGVAIGDSQTDNVQSYSLIVNAAIDATCSNEGISGNRLVDMDSRFIADADPANKSFVIIQGGVNDIIAASSDPNTAMQSAMSSMVNKCTSNNAEPIIINISPWKDSTNWSSEKQGWTETYNTWLTSYCSINTIKLINVYTALASENDSEKLANDYDSGDNIHWSYSADIVIGDLVCDYLRLTATKRNEDKLSNTIGLACWPSSINRVSAAEYRDFTHANWTKTNGSITSGDVTLIDGSVVANKNTFTATSNNATIIKSSYFSIIGTHACGFFIKRKSGTGAIALTLNNGGTWTNVTSEITSTAWHLVQIYATTMNPRIGIRLAVSGDAVYLDWAQLVKGDRYVSIHPIKGGETLAEQTFVGANATSMPKLIKDKQGYIITQLQLLPENYSLQKAEIINNGEDISYIAQGTNSISSDDGTNNLVYSNSIVGLSKVASYWWDTYKQLSVNGNSVSQGDYDQSFGNSNLKIGTKHNGIITLLEFGAGRKTTQAEMENKTT